MYQKVSKVAGIVGTGILTFIFLWSACLKLSLNENAVAQALAFGINEQTYIILGIIEIAAIVLFIFRRTGVLGLLFLTAYLGGAIATHLQHQQSVIIPACLEILLWITAFIRFPEFKNRLMSTNSKAKERTQ